MGRVTSKRCHYLKPAGEASAPHLASLSSAISACAVGYSGTRIDRLVRMSRRTRSSRHFISSISWDALRVRALCGIARLVKRDACGSARTIDEPDVGSTPFDQRASTSATPMSRRRTARARDVSRGAGVVLQRATSEFAVEAGISADAVHQRLSRGRQLVAAEVSELVEHTLERVGELANLSRCSRRCR